MLDEQGDFESERSANTLIAGERGGGGCCIGMTWPTLNFGLTLDFSQKQFEKKKPIKMWGEKLLHKCSSLNANTKT